MTQKKICAMLSPFYFMEMPPSPEMLSCNVVAKTNFFMLSSTNFSTPSLSPFS
jgi:hypothetical protein